MTIPRLIIALTCTLSFLATLSASALAAGCDDLRRGLNELEWATSPKEMVAAVGIVRQALPEALQERKRTRPLPSRVNRQLKKATDALALLRTNVGDLVKEVRRAENARNYQPLLAAGLGVFHRSEMVFGEISYFSLCLDQ